MLTILPRFNGLTLLKIKNQINYISVHYPVAGAKYISVEAASSEA